MTYATVQDVADTLGRPISDPTEITQVQSWLRRVESRIKSRIPDLDGLATDAEYRQTLTDVEADVVVRRVKNPDGKVSEGVDDYQYRLNNDAARPDLWPTAEEWLLLLPTVALPGVFTVDLGTPVL